MPNSLNFPSPLPIDALLPRIAESLGDSPRLIIEAAPGSGKTTRVPLALLRTPWLGGHKIIMLEPRRLAARTAAGYMARLLGESAGGTVGWRTALESKESTRTRILVVTEGILTRMLQADPGLEGTGCLIFDEFHERSLHADLGLALALECQEALRPDLRLAVMSATLDSGPLARLMGNCPRLAAEGRSFPVEVRHVAPSRSDASRRCEDRVAAAVHQTLREERGSILAFLPGAGEIRRAAERLEDSSLPAGVRIFPLYGDMSSAAQDAAVVPSAPGERKVVLATNIAESGITIEGVRIVVDSGLERRQRVDVGLGMNRLVTERIPRDSAEQRCGRAGRTEPGLCLRLWPEHEHAALQPRRRPEILDGDLASLCLELAVWGRQITDEPPFEYFLDAPPNQAWLQAGELLRSLGAIDSAGRVSDMGGKMAGLPLHPRLAHMVLEGVKNGMGRTACALAAVLSERDPLRAEGAFSASKAGADIRLRSALLLDGAGEYSSDPREAAGGLVRRLREQMRRIAGRAGAGARLGESSSVPEPFKAGILLAYAWPERVALRRANGSFLTANGRGAALAPGDALASHEFLSIAALDLGAAGNADARIHLAAPLRREDLEHLFGGRILQEDSAVWDAERSAVSARSLRKLGALVLSETLQSDPPADKVKSVLLEGLGRAGLSRLPWTPELESWRRRVRYARGVEAALAGGDAAAADAGVGKEPVWPDLSDTALAATLPEWLGPYLDGIDRLSRISSGLLGQALRGILPWNATRLLDDFVPDSLTVPSGSEIQLDYGAAADELERAAASKEVPAELPGPVLAVKLQELFGLAATPAVANGRVPVIIHMLSPAARPVQITRDLGGFWKSSYAAVRADLRGRYPKHPWPEDPLTALPTKHTKKRMEGTRSGG